MKTPIIITGMGHSGTTVLARYLGSAPGWKRWVNGQESKHLECDELLHPSIHREDPDRDVLIPTPLKERTDGTQGKRLLAICEADPETRFVFKRPWLERDPAWVVNEFGFAHILICVRPFVDLWESWNKPGSVMGCGLRPGGTVDAGWDLWTEQMEGAATLQFLGCVQGVAFVDHGMFCRNPKYVDWILSRWGIAGEFSPNYVKPSKG